MQDLCNPFALIRERLQTGGTCYYMPNGGNLGDCLIASSTIQSLDRYRIPWRYIRGNRDEVKPGDVLVYGGGGSLVSYYHGAIECLESLLRLGLDVIVLPQTVNGHHDFWTLRRSITIFCRDSASLTYLSSFASTTSFFYHDMATLLDLTQEPFSSVVRLHYALIASRSPSRLSVFRDDVERMMPTQQSSTDVAAVAFPSMYSTDIIHANSCILLAALAGHSKIYTDRLHVAIGASLLGIPVDLYDTCHQKNSSVYMSTLRYRYPLLRFRAPDDVPEI
jgi:exopolysaccharide biosynthesis predicted pyruvyltransferase EpsI